LIKRGGGITKELKELGMIEPQNKNKDKKDTDYTYEIGRHYLERK